MVNTFESDLYAAYWAIEESPHKHMQEAWRAEWKEIRGLDNFAIPSAGFRILRLLREVEYYAD